MENKAEQVFEELQVSNSKLHDIFNKDYENFKEFREWLFYENASETVLSIIDELIDTHRKKTSPVYLKPYEVSQAIETGKFLYDVMHFVYHYDI